MSELFSSRFCSLGFKVKFFWFSFIWASELGFRPRGWGFRVLRLWCEVAGVGDFVAIAEGRLRFQGRKKRQKEFP